MDIFLGYDRFHKFDISSEDGNSQCRGRITGSWLEFKCILNDDDLCNSLILFWSTSPGDVPSRGHFLERSGTLKIN